MVSLQEGPTKKVSLGFLVLYGLANASAILAVMPVLGILIPAQVTAVDVANSANNLAFVLGFGATGAFLGNPIGGALSDRTVSRHGRRRPWIVVGALATAGGLVLLAYSHSILWLAVGWFIVQFFGNVLFAAHAAVQPDYIPVNQRGATQSILGLTSPIFLLGGTYFLGRVDEFRAGYFPLIGLLLLMNLAFVLYYQEAPVRKEELPVFEWKTYLAAFWFNPKKQPVFAKAWIAWLLIWTGYTLGSGSFLYMYVQHIVGYETLFAGQTVKEGISNIGILQTLFGVPVMLLVGVLSDRLNMRKIFVVLSVVLVAIGMGLLTMNLGWTALVVVCVAIGVGFRVFFGLGAALMSEILPSASDRGKDLGVINIASTIPQIVLPGVGAAVIYTWGLASPTGYQVLFGGALALSLLGAALLQSMRGVR